MHRILLALFLGITDLTLAHLAWVSIARSQTLGISVLLLTIVAALCHALWFWA
ncbi:MAG: hypothetical protein P4L90_24115 [Rhodopila sp.]|nr:hypothetical protein [Rhodopila sp.]